MQSDMTRCRSRMESSSDSKSSFQFCTVNGEPILVRISSLELDTTIFSSSS